LPEGPRPVLRPQRAGPVGGFKPERYHIQISSAAALRFSVFALERPPHLFNAGAEDERRRFIFQAFGRCPP
jgi:hypothetical protein